MMIRNKVAALCLSLVLSLGMLSAQAAMVNFTITGEVLFGDEYSPNSFGLTAGDIVTVSGMFDDSVLAGGTGYIVFDSFNTANVFDIAVGNTVLTQMDDIGYLSGGAPSMSLNNYQLVDFDMFTSGFSSFGNGFDDGLDMYGEWNSTVQISAVPVPAAVWLFGSGLLAIAGLVRRKKA